MFHVAEKPSRDLVWGNQKAHRQQKRLLDHLAFFVYFYVGRVLNIDTVVLHFGAFGLSRLCERLLMMVALVCSCYIPHDIRADKLE